MSKLVMGYWDCPFCGSKEIRGDVTNCPSCGRARGDVQFYMKDHAESQTREQGDTADIEYVENISFMGDIHVIWETIGKVLKRENISAEGMDTAEDYGDYLLRTGRINQIVYDRKQQEAQAWIKAAEAYVV